MIHILTALACEARPLIARFGMEPIPAARPFRVFEGEGIALIVSGMGKLAAAAAVGFGYAYGDGGRNQAWLNVGVGGCADRPIGQGVLAHRVTDEATGRSWFPGLAFEFPCPSETIRTVDRPETDFADSSVYEMEASGFCSAAGRLTTAELVHCYKVVSDTRDTALDEASPKKIQGLIEDRLDEIASIVGSLQDLSRMLETIQADPASYREIIERWHFTVTQRRQLRRLLQRHEALASRETISISEFEGISRGADVIAAIEQRLQALPVRLD